MIYKTESCQGIDWNGILKSITDHSFGFVAKFIEYFQINNLCVIIISIWLLTSIGLPVFADSFEQELVVGCGADQYSKAKHYLSFAKKSPYVWITEPLVFRGNDYKPRPGLVESWERSGKRYTLHIRKGINFHNGEALDANAVLNSLKINAFNRSETLRINPESYRIIDKYTLEFETAHNTVHFIGFLSHPFVSAYAPDTDFINHPIGTGPYKFAEYSQGRFIKVVRNEDYWGEKPLNKSIMFRFIPDPQARLLSLLNGECDIIWPVDPQMLNSLPPDGPYKKVITSRKNYVVMTVNLHGEKPYNLLSDQNVRKAVAYAIDRKQISETIYKDLAQPARSILSPWFWNQGENFLKGYDYQPDTARKLLDESGWTPGPDGICIKNNRRLRIRLVSGFPTAAELKPLPELIQQMLRKVGIDVEVVQTDDMGVYYGNYMAPGKGDLFLEKSENTGPTPSWLLYMLYHSNSPWVDSGYKWALPGEKFDQAIEKAQANTNQEIVVEAIREAQRVLIDETCAVIPLLFLSDVYLVRPGLEFNPEINGGYTSFGNARKSDPVRTENR
jgi:peptide/nickel transport system substrate-binding protein